MCRYLCYFLLFNSFLELHAMEEAKDGPPTVSTTITPPQILTPEPEHTISDLLTGVDLTVAPSIEKEKGQESDLVYGRISDHPQKFKNPKDMVKRITKDTKKFRTKKKRKLFELPEDADVTDYFLSRSEIPITYFTALSIDGGGIRGLIPALLSQKLAKVTNRHPYEIFDYIGGTSIGGIVALGMTARSQTHRSSPAVTIDELVNLFSDSNLIFPRDDMGENQPKFYQPHLKLWQMMHSFFGQVSSLNGPKYSPSGLEKLLKDKFGVTNYLHDTLTNTLVTSVDVKSDQRCDFVFDSRDAKTLYNDPKIRATIPIWQVGRATSAAPTYFPTYPFTVKGSQNKDHNYEFIDGGLWVNNPAAHVVKRLIRWAKNENMIASNKNVVLLSLGTGYTHDNPFPSSAGLLTSIIPVIDTLMNVSSLSTDATMEELLGKRNYLRLNPKLDTPLNLDAPLNDTHPNWELLTQAAESCFGELEDFIAGDEGPLRKILEADFRKEGHHSALESEKEKEKKEKRQDN